MGSSFTHDDLDAVLSRFVDGTGRVDYTALAKDRDALDRYYASLGEFSPDSHPDRFPTSNHVLAYWINAYNAAAIVFVLDAFPISSVRDVRPPWFFRVPPGAGFFLQRVPLGGASATLYGLENVVIRKRFADARVHFALNCASISCPRLPRGAFVGERLEEQLRAETALFLSERRNVEIDLEARRIIVSEIFKWYRGDFEKAAPPGESDLRGYLQAALVEVGSPLATALQACAECPIVFRPYDWGLNVAESTQ